MNFRFLAIASVFLVNAAFSSPKMLWQDAFEKNLESDLITNSQGIKIANEDRVIENSKSYYKVLAQVLLNSSLKIEEKIELLKEIKSYPSNLERLIATFIRKKLHFYKNQYQDALNSGSESYRKSLRLKWPTLFLESMRYDLISLSKLNKKRQFVRLYRVFKKSRNSRKSYPKIDQIAAKIWFSLGDYQASHQIKENLLKEFPLTEESKWAFNSLNKLSCSEDLKKRYHFSMKSLQNLTKNIGLDNGVRKFILFKTEEPLIHSTGKFRRMTRIERIKALTSLRLYPEAFKIANLVYRTQRKLLSSKEDKEIIITLGQLANKVGRYEDATFYYSEYRRKYSQQKFNEELKELLADSLRYGGHKNSAANFYSLVAQHTNDRLNRWHHFWSTYIGEGAGDALGILANKDNYVPSRDLSHPEGVRYWQAKIKEKTSGYIHAKDDFRKVLLESRDRIYSYFILSRYPILAEEKYHVGKNKMVLRDDIRRHTELILGKGGKCGHESTHASLRVVEQLCNYQMRNIAAKLLKGIRWRKLDSKNKTSYLTLAYALNSHDLVYKYLDAHLFVKKRDKISYFSYIENQKKNPSFWKMYYPQVEAQFLDELSKFIKIDRMLIWSIMRSESLYDKDAISWVGAKGLMQIMPYTGIRIARHLKDYEYSNEYLINSKLNIAYSAWYIEQLLTYFNGSKVLAVAAYNAGPRAVNRWIERCQSCEIDEFIETISYKETRTYVKKVFRHYERYKRIYQNGMRSIYSTLVPKEKGDLNLEIF